MRIGKPLTPLLSGVCLIILLFLSTAWLAFTQDVNKKQVKYLVNQSRRTLAYKVSDRHAALFKIGSQEKMVEIISNLDISNEIGTAVTDNEFNTDDLVKKWEYALEVTILDSDLKPLSKQVYWERAHMTEWTDKKTGNPMKAAYYLYESVQSADSRITTIQIPESTKDERFIAVKIHSPESSSASIRMYKHLNFDGNKDSKSLKPMRRYFRTKLARHSLFGSDLTQKELNRSMSDMLAQIPAETRQGYEYKTRQLFLYDSCSPLLGADPVKTGFPDNLDQPVYFPVTGPAKLELTVSGRESINTTIWRDSVLLSESQRKPSKKGILKFDFGPGKHLLKIVDPSGSQKLIRTKAKPPGAWLGNKSKDSDPLPLSKTVYYRILPGTEGVPLTVKLPASMDNSTRMIKMLCRLITDKPNSTQAKLSYRYLDVQGNVIDNGKILLNANQSDLVRYYSNQDNSGKLTRAQRWYFCPPTTATSMELISDKIVEAAFFNKLEAHDKQVVTKGPSSNKSSELMDVKYKPVDSEISYFYFRPSNAKLLAETNRKHVLCIPEGIIEATRPEEINEEKYAISLYPQEASERIFDPFDKQSDMKNCYIQLLNKKPTSMTVKGIAGEARMGFHYSFNESSARPELMVTIDDKTQTRFRPITYRGYFEIPPLEKGQHEIKISATCSTGQFFMKLPPNVYSESPLYKPRKVFRLDPGKSLTIPVDYHQSITGLNILTYQSTLSDSPTHLNVFTNASPQPNHPLHCLTTTNVDYIGNNKSDSDRTPVFFNSGNTLKSPECFFFALHDDLQPDRYQINVQSLSAEPVYLRFFIMNPGNRQET